MTALSAVQVAAQASAASGKLEPFLEATGAGVSANLCDAVAALQDSTDARSLGFAVSWAPLRGVSGSMPSRLSIGTDLVPVIREASRLFKAAAPQEEFELQGLVVRADRPSDAETGTITVAGVVETELRQVRVRLGEADYNIAVTAHRDRTPIHCVGELQKDGRHYILLNPRGFGTLDVEA